MHIVLQETGELKESNQVCRDRDCIVTISKGCGIDRNHSEGKVLAKIRGELTETQCIKSLGPHALKPYTKYHSAVCLTSENYRKNACVSGHSPCFAHGLHEKRKFYKPWSTGSFSIRG